MADLKIKIGATITDLQAKLATVNAKIKGLGRSIKSAMGGIGGGIAAALSVGALSAGIKKLVDFGDQIGKSAKRIGITNEEFQKLGFASERSGSSIENVERAFKRMSSTIYDAGQGLAASKDALNAIGLTFDVLNGKSPEKQFAMIAAALNNVQDATTKAALAQDIFGRAGTELLPMIGDYAALSKEVKDLGGIMSDEAVKAAEDFKDSMTNLSTAIKAGIGDTGIISWLADIAKGVSEIKQASDELKKGGGSFIPEWLKDADEWMKFINGYVTPQGLFNKAVDLIPDKPVVTSAVTPSEKRAAREKTDANRKEQKEMQDAKEKASAQIEESKKNAVFDTGLKDVFGEQDKAQSKVLAQIEKEDEAEQRKQETIKGTIQQMEESLRIQELLLQGKEREAAIQSALNRAPEGADTAQLGTIAELAGKEFDISKKMGERNNQSQRTDDIYTDALTRLGGGMGKRISSTVKQEQQARDDRRDNILNEIQTNTKRLADGESENTPQWP